MTDPQDFSDRKTVRKAAKAAKAAERARAGFILNLMASMTGRTYIHGLLLRCHIFQSSFTPDAISMAFNEGERNIGLQLLNDVMSHAPDQYITMMREANERSLAADRRPERDQPNGGRDDSPGQQDTDESADERGYESQED